MVSKCWRRRSCGSDAVHSCFTTLLPDRRRREGMEGEGGEKAAACPLARRSIVRQQVSDAPFCSHWTRARRVKERRRGRERRRTANARWRRKRERGERNRVADGLHSCQKYKEAQRQRLWWCFIWASAFAAASRAFKQQEFNKGNSSLTVNIIIIIIIMQYEEKRLWSSKINQQKNNKKS